MAHDKRSADPITPVEAERELDRTDISPAQPYGPGRIDASDVADLEPSPPHVKSDHPGRMEN